MIRAGYTMLRTEPVVILKDFTRILLEELEADCPLRGNATRRVRGLAIDEPIKPTPMSASRSNNGFSVVMTANPHGGASRPPHELGQGRNNETVRLFGADAHAQCMRKLVGTHLT